ncbi:response regulator [Thalassococcus profundi]|uniref:histidine kinase n=1 Tax=Thalassococcus profundi TaxID=2282382 RepID=A0A369TL02_9RHOB|nr:ATP-binding protein [Thalassococcus profundi]RDD66009.1 response regulator [Thalassococcus profundi]
MSNLKASPVRLRLLITLLLGAVALGVTLYLSTAVVRDLRLLNSARSDNVQWTLSQAEVEFLEYDLHLNTSLGNLDPDLRTLRREFDIFYSRINTLRQASIYSALRDVPEFSRNLRIVQTFLDRTVDTIDASDTALTGALPELIERAEAVRPNVRQLANSGLNYFAEDSDRRRSNIAVTLMQMAAVVTVLLVTLLLLALYLAYLNAQNVRRRAEIVQASERMKIVTGTALDAVVVSDAEGRILDFNAAAEQIFGYSAAEAIGADLGGLIVPDHHRAAHAAGMERMRVHGEKRVVGKGRIKLEAKRATGEVFPVEFAIQSAQTDEGEIFIAFLRDISHRVKAEADLVAARDQALAGEKAKTDFLATMSHEIRTPLNGLLGNLSLLRDTKLSARQARYINNMDTSGKLLMNHISDVLDITKYDAGKLHLRPVQMNISTLLQDIIDNQSGAASANDTTLDWGWIGPPADWIHADRDRIQHILMNVIGNAVKFTQAGRVSVQAEVLSAPDSAPELHVTVSDTGIGMDDTLQSQIFDDFLTGDSSYDREVGGTGLGLGIARRFVQALGGGIDVESTLGEGSTFLIRFPITPIAAPAATGPHRRLRSGELRPSRVLLVEDNEINRVVAREMLVAAGHRVTEAANGKVAVDLAQNKTFDLILMDISMPVMDGRTATRQIRDGNGVSARTPIVALTANAMAEEQQAFLSDGMNDILTKPLTRDGLMQVIANHVHRDTDPPAFAKDASKAVAGAYLDDLRETLGVEALRPLLDRFVTEVNDTLAFLADHHSHAPAEIAARAHRIAGSAATLGAVELRAGLIAVETAANAGDEKGMAKAIAALPAIWFVTRPQMRADRDDAPDA